MKRTTLREGDRVRHKDGSGVNFGTVTRVLPGQWSNGGVPMVRVRWDNGGSRRYTASALEKV